jgi:CheY-like chemotaxis protein
MKKTQALIVDDSMSARFALNRSLEPYALNISVAKTAEEALATVAETQFDLIFMDHVLPGMSGLEAVEAIRALDTYNGAPIVMCTSNDSAQYIQEALDRGATAVMRKPPDKDALAQVMRTCLTPNEEAPPQASAPLETADMNESDKLKAVDERLDRLEAMLQRLEESVNQMDARTQAAARVIANHAGNALANRLFKAMMLLKGK